MGKEEVREGLLIPEHRVEDAVELLHFKLRQVEALRALSLLSFVPCSELATLGELELRLLASELQQPLAVQ